MTHIINIINKKFNIRNTNIKFKRHHKEKAKLQSFISEIRWKFHILLNFIVLYFYYILFYNNVIVFCKYLKVQESQEHFYVVNIFGVWIEIFVFF